VSENLFIRACILGFSIAAPVGPIGVLCIRRTLAQGQLVGLASGLGAATADAVYGVIAGFGLSFITQLLVQQQIWLRLIGGLFLCYLGIKSIIKRPVGLDTQEPKRDKLGAYASTFMLTLTNPMTILSFTAIFASAGLGEAGLEYGHALTMVGGVFAGSAFWWLILSLSVGLLRHKMKSQSLMWINRISGLIITIFGVVSLIGVLTDFALG
jgi:threonine/homoserine/homoserine lactone efflux protein